MNPSQTRNLISLIVLAGIHLAGGCSPDRQTVYTIPRGKMVPDRPGNRVKTKTPSVKAQVPANQPLPESNGIDVPIVQP